MALNLPAVALTMLIATAQSSPPPAPTAPAGTPETRYCLRVDPLPGSRIETVQCKTRDEWATLEVDVDQEWAENGVRVIA